MVVIKKVVVAGAGGNLGRFVVEALQKADFSVSVLAQPNSTSEYPPNVTRLSTDYTLTSLSTAFEGQDAVVSCIGVARMASQMGMISAAAEAGVKRFIPSEFGWAMDRPLMPELRKRLAEKEMSMDHLVKTCEANPNGMTWTAISTGPFLEWALLKAPALGFIVPQRTARIVDGGDEPFTASTGAAIGDAVVGTLQKPEETKNRWMKVYSLELTQNSLLAALEKATDSKWTVNNLTTNELIEGRAAKLSEGNVLGAFIDVIAQQLFEKGKERARHVEEGMDDNALLGVKEESIEEVVQRLVGG